MLDMESVRLFVLTAELGNLTRAAEAVGTVQPVVSQRLKGLERALGRKLLERTPRFVRLTEDGAAFLDRARDLLASHDAAVRFADASAIGFSVGVSDHALGLTLAPMIRRLRAVLPAHATINIRTGGSQEIRRAFDDGLLDAAVTRRDGGGTGGEVLGTDPVGWRAAEGWSIPAGAPVPLALLAAPCGVRAAAIRQLENAGRPWREAFTGGSCAVLLAGVQAGLGIAPMGRIASGNMPDAGPMLGLPALPESEIVLFARTGSPVMSSAVRALEAVIRSGFS